MKLAELQKHFIDHLFERNSDAGLHSIIAPTYYGKTDELLGIYKNSTQHGLKAILVDIFPVCECLVGEAFFGQLTKRYILQYPSSCFDLGEYGNQFPQFLSENSETLCLETVPYLWDVAQFELHWHQALNQSTEEGVEKDAEEGVVVVQPIGELQMVDDNKQSDIQLHPPPVLRFFESEYPVLDIWLSNKKNTTDKAAIEADIGADIDITKGGVFVLIWRDLSFNLRMEKVSDAQMAWVSAIKNNRSFGEMLEQFQHSFEELLLWSIQNGLTIGFSVRSNNPC
ncbi:MAG: putative DNA-binding domain-containing protein [Pseudomonadales bacterium]|nr:putative DNA-binding domain-containing protein [Pseudomonadales bacterium]